LRTFRCALSHAAARPDHDHDRGAAAEWPIRLVDRNTEELSEDDLEWADLVMTGGMLPQYYDLVEVIDLCRARGKPIACGGPSVTSTPEFYRRANFRIVGEAEGVMAEFLAAWEDGETEGVFEAEKFQADVTKSPTPRFDLLNFANYLYVGVQFSRGCPFTCEFCDIIELYGRAPRTKNTAQMLTELETLYQLGYRDHFGARIHHRLMPFSSWSAIHRPSLVACEHQRV
jgi:radical SAM superfamily enzyme YgiQ (UPF0313 family)